MSAERTAIHRESVYEAVGGAEAAYPDDAADVPEGLQIPRWSWDGLSE
jgi:hypothetical protein